MLRSVIFGAILSAVTGLAALGFISIRQVDRKPNVLFICIDDLRPDLKAYGNPQVHAPNLDRLAGQATVFINHYVTQPTCGASRYSLLTGRLPRHPV